jgi:hypothetical protein
MNYHHANDDGKTALRIVLVGQPGAGKSALAEALVNRAEANVPTRFVFEEASELAQAAGADALLYLIPVSELSPAQEELAEVLGRLQYLQNDRGERTDIAGLPFYVVLTQCDRLVSPGENLSFLDWIDRIEKRKGEVYRALLPLAQGTKPGFGRLDLHVVATAVRRPVVRGQDAARLDRPFGVDELCQRSLELAHRYRRRAWRSNRRLAGLVMLAVCLPIVLTGLSYSALMWQRVDRAEADRKALKAATVDEERRLRFLTERGAALWRFAGFDGDDQRPLAWRDWQDQVEAFLAQASLGNKAADERLPGSYAATYGQVFEQPAIAKLHQAWEEAHARLERRRELTAAFGLTDSPPSKPALLHIPSDFRSAAAAQLREQLLVTYPLSAEWSLADLPPKASVELRDAIEISLGNLLHAGRKEVLRHLQQAPDGGKDTRAQWDSVRTWIKNPVELGDWQFLVDKLQRWLDSKGPDPVTALRSFLEQDHFDVELGRLTLRIPAHVGVQPDGKLRIRHDTGDEVRTALVFSQKGDGQREPGGDARNYSFVPESGETVVYRLVYKPGDALWVELPVKGADNRDMLLTWSASRSLVYQFECLGNPPRLHAPTAPAASGTATEDVMLILENGKLPPIPGLLPSVRQVPE